MKNIVIIIFIITSIGSFSQSPSKTETQKWIKETIESYPYQSSNTINNFKVEFKGSSMVIYHRLKIHLVKNIIKYKVTIPLKNLMKVRFKEKQDNIRMVFRIKGNKKEILSNDIDSYRYKSYSELALSSSIDYENLRPRLIKAFDHLIKLNGGRKVKETF